MSHAHIDAASIVLVRFFGEQAAENALIGMIAPDGVIGGGTGTAGAIVAMDVTNGDVLAMARLPNYEEPHVSS